MLRSLVVASAWWVSTQAVVVDEDAGAKKDVLLQGEAKVVEVSEHLLKNYLQNDGTAVPSFSEEDRSEEEASAFTGYSWTSKGVEMGKEADFFQRSANPVAGAAVLASEFEKFGQAGVASPTVLAENGYIQTESATALKMEEAEEQAKFFVWTQKGIDKGLKSAFFEEGSVPSAGQTVTGRDFKHFTEILAPDNELLKKLQGAPISFVSRRGKGRKGKGRKGKGRKGKGRKGKGRKGKGRKGKGRKGKGRKGKGRNPLMLVEETAEIGGEDNAEEYDEVDSEVEGEDSEADSNTDYDSEEEQNDVSTDDDDDDEYDAAEGSGENGEA